MNPKDLLNDPNLVDIDKRKLQIILDLANKAPGRTPAELMPYLLSATSKATSMGASFNNEEVDLIIQLLKKDMSDGDKKKVDTVRQLMSTMNRTKK